MVITIFRAVKLLFILLVMGVGKMEASKPEHPPYIQYVDEIVAQMFQEMEDKYNLQPFGDGGRMPYDVEAIRVKFVAYRKATIEQARELEVRATQRLLEIINSHEKIRPFLREFPFSHSRAEVSISFLKDDDTEYQDGSVAFVCQAKDRLCYAQFDPKTNKLRDLAKEPYEEALKIVQSSPPSFDITSPKKRV